MLLILSSYCATFLHPKQFVESKSHDCVLTRPKIIVIIPLCHIMLINIRLPLAALLTCANQRHFSACWKYVYVGFRLPHSRQRTVKIWWVVFLRVKKREGKSLVDYNKAETSTSMKLECSGRGGVNGVKIPILVKCTNLNSLQTTVTHQRNYEQNLPQ